MEHSTNLLQGILLLLVMSVASVAAFRTFKLPPILGYLLVGALSSENALGWLPENHSIEFMAEVGVVFLLFAIGLEFSVSQFMAMRRTVLGLGGLQMIFSTIIGFILLNYLNVSWQGAIVAAGAMALSSTAIVVKQLTDQGEMHERHGQLALGILLFQDIAVVPFIIAIPLLSTNTTADPDFIVMALHAFGNILVLALMLVTAHYVLRPLFHKVANAQSVELFNITVLLVALTSAWVTQSLGMSLALGAFLAGMLLSETEYKHQIETEIRPFRDILMGLFFITVGAKLNLAVLPELWLSILWLLLGIVVFKAILIGCLVRLFGNNKGIAVRTGLVLAQGGEFGFALLSLALSYGLLTADEVQADLAAIVISMAIAPLIIRSNDKVTRKLLRDSYLRQRYKDAHAFRQEVREVDNHVIICGYRRVGQGLARLLEEQGVPYLGLELDSKIVTEAWEAGESVYYADASRTEILMAAGIQRARLVVITVVDTEIAKEITEAARKKNKNIPIVVRARDDTYLEALIKLGATEVLPESLEASVMVARRVLEKLELPNEEIEQVVGRIRIEGYKQLKSFFHGTPQKATSKSETFLHSIVLLETDKAVGKRIADLNLESMGITLKALKRGEIRGDQPSPEMVLQTDDTLILEGKADRFKEIEKKIHGERKEKEAKSEAKPANSVTPIALAQLESNLSKTDH
ncbi:monovalent cation:proton antiporter family protein [uncultured Thiothrix sp.]|uniref:monovalent cation:proton antiporter family protein n=1 Tax=uncultured Thiothrix sp. TaxID=223185 RepID=UPI00262F6256|nr:monovalent cation:proton antiporter family protein [uncultured Thiothrix sp.]HMT92959.1 cation:proton antiporter [Thiolinea sp.]